MFHDWQGGQAPALTDEDGGRFLVIEFRLVRSVVKIFAHFFETTAPYRSAISFKGH
jgi:hypothetical protein